MKTFVPENDLQNRVYKLISDEPLIVLITMIQSDPNNSVKHHIVWSLEHWIIHL